MVESRMLNNWRGRRLLACRAVDDLERIIDHLGVEDGSELPPPNGLPAVTSGHQNELRNAAALLLRMILGANDGNVSPARLQRW